MPYNFPRILPILTALLLPLIILFSAKLLVPAFAVCMLGLFIAARGRVAPPLLAPLWPVALLLLWFVASSLWSITPEHSLHKALAAIAMTAFGLYSLALMRNVALLVTAGRVAMAVIVIVICLLLLQEELLHPQGVVHHLHQWLELADVEYRRFYYKNSNRGLSTYVVIAWPILAGLLTAGYRKLAWAMLGVLLISTLTYHSLSAKLGLVAAIFAFLLLWRAPKTTGRIMVWAIPLMLLAFPFVFTVVQHYLPEGGTLWNMLPESSRHRLQIWHVLMETMPGHWLLGWGMEATRNLPLSEAQLAYIHLPQPPLHPHNPSIQLLVEGGAIALVLGSLALYAALRAWNSLPHTPVEKAFTGAMLVSYLGIGLFAYGIWQSWWILVFWLGWALWRWLSPAPRPLA